MTARSSGGFPGTCFDKLSTNGRGRASGREERSTVVEAIYGRENWGGHPPVGGTMVGAGFGMRGTSEQRDVARSKPCDAVMRTIASPSTTLPDVAQLFQAGLDIGGQARLATESTTQRRRQLLAGMRGADDVSAVHGDAVGGRLTNHDAATRALG